MATHKKLMTLFTKYGFDAQQRHELVYAWTGGRTQSTTQLHELEMTDLCFKLQNDFRFRTNTDAYVEAECKRKRSVVLSIATRTGIHTPEDWVNFNRFMKNSSVLKKSLNKYNINELDRLVKQFRGLEANYNKSARKFGSKAHAHKHGLPKISEN